MPGVHGHRDPWAGEQVERLAMMLRWVALGSRPDHMGVNPIRLLLGLPLEARKHGNLGVTD